MCTRATVVGCTVGAGPERSTTPSISPVRGSWMGLAVQVHGCWARTKCSAENSCTEACSASAVPMAFVPTEASVQSAPGMKPRESASRPTRTAPSRQSTKPSAAVTTMMCSASSATAVRLARSWGSTLAMGDPARRRSTTSGAAGSSRDRPSGATP